MNIHKETAAAILEAVGLTDEERKAYMFEMCCLPPDELRERRYCCICGKRIEGYGNEPWPIVLEPGERCCDLCNLTEVVPARMRQLKERKRMPVMDCFSMPPIDD